MAELIITTISGLKQKALILRKGQVNSDAIDISLFLVFFLLPLWLDHCLPLGNISSLQVALLSLSFGAY
jgi:hypothetical protein